MGDFRMYLDNFSNLFDKLKGIKCDDDLIVTDLIHGNKGKLEGDVTEEWFKLEKVADILHRIDELKMCQTGDCLRAGFRIFGRSDYLVLQWICFKVNWGE
jgi:hypothetical protein